MQRSFQFTPEVSVDLELKYEKYFGICVACGLFLHGPEDCDKVLQLSESSPNSLSLEGSKGLRFNSGSLQVASIGGNVVSLGVGTKLASWKEVDVGTNVPKPLFPGLGSKNPLFWTESLGRFNPGQGLGAASKPLFSVKGFAAQAYLWLFQS